MPKFATICAKEFPDSKTTKPHILPLYLSSSFVFENIEEGIDIFKGNKKAHVYGRYSNPTVDTVGNKLAYMETMGTEIDARCIMVSSGMSAISTVCLGLLKPGDKILTQANLYGGTTELFTKILGQWGVTPVYTNLQGLDWIEEQLKTDHSIRMIYGETPANPSMACIDLKKVGALGRKYGVFTMVDNTFATPYLQRPLAYDIDFVIHSTTKYLNGHGTGICGAIIGAKGAAMDKVSQAMKLVGTNTNPFDAWLVNNGIKTLKLRMDKQCENALAIAEWLEKQNNVIKVNYPGLKSHPDHQLAKAQMSQFGAMLSFELDGGIEEGKKFMNKLKICTLAPTLGDMDTLVLHPASSSHLNVDRDARILNGITDGLIRLSVGIEDTEDLIEDIRQAF